MFDVIGEILRTNLQMSKIMPFITQLRSSKIKKKSQEKGINGDDMD